jgi:Domain of unknown function (DUF4279)
MTGASLTVLLDSDDPGPALRALGAPADREWPRGIDEHSGFELCSSLPETATPSEHAEELIQRLRPLAPALREIRRHPDTHSIRLTVAEHADNTAIGLDEAAITLLAAIGAEFVADVSVEEAGRAG